MNALGLVSRGYLGQSTATNAAFVEGLEPEVFPEDLSPEINMRETAAPRMVAETVHDLKPTIRRKPRP